jgi:sugar O-acyltransferase (sialic acid O-acetyltransferase NeuD family)
MRDIVFWGGTGQAKVLDEAIHGTDMRLVAVIDNRAIPSPIAGVPLLVGVEEFDAWLAKRGGAVDLLGAVAIGGARGGDRIMLMDLLHARGLLLPTIVHLTAFVAHNATLGEGCQILAQSAVCAHANLGRGVIVNTAASVDHDGMLADGVHIAPGARIAGEVTIGARAFVGTGAVILPRLVIGDDAVVGAGAVVTKDVPPGTTVLGNPARPKK